MCAPSAENISLYTNAVVGQVEASKRITGANEKQLACAKSQNCLKFSITHKVPGVTSFKQLS